MKKNITLILVAIALCGSNAVLADTVNDTDLAGAECRTVNLSSPFDVETITCFTTETTAVYNNPSPEGPVTINVEHYIGAGSVPLPFNMVQCLTTGVYADCLENDVISYVRGNGITWGNTPRGLSSDFVTPSLSAGTYALTFRNRAEGQDGVACFRSGHSCSLSYSAAFGNSYTTGGTLTVESTPPASVLLQISEVLEKSFYSVLSIIGLIDSAYAENN